LRATALRERLKDGSWIIRHLPGLKLVADFLTKIIAVKPSWERFWRFVNHQGSGVPIEEPSTGSNRREEQPLGEEQHPEEPDQEAPSWDNYRDIAGRCVSVVKKVVGLAEKHPELADFRHEALSIAVGRLVQVLADAYRVTESVVKDRFQLESVLPFLEKKNIPGQEDRPEEEEPRGILKRGNRSKRGNSKPKRVHFWDESPPILKVLRVQDHHGHVTQEHSAGKVEPFPKTIQGGGQGKRWDLYFSRSKRKDNRAAEVVPRSGSTEPRDLVATRGMGFLGNSNVIGKGKNHPDTLRGIAPQPTVFRCFSVRELGLSATIYFSKGFGLKSILVCLAAPVTAMDREDVSQGVFGQFFGILYAMMVILVWEVFRWLMGHLTLLVVPQFNRQMVEQAELMVKLALKDREKDVRGGEGHSTAAPTVEKDEHQEEETRPGEDHRVEKRRKTEERDADRAHDKKERRRDRRRRGDTGRSRSPHREKESTTRRSEGEKSPGPSTAESPDSGRVTKGPIAPLPEGMKAPIDANSQGRRKSTHR
jgi:hypothetical protein